MPESPLNGENKEMSDNNHFRGAKAPINFLPKIFFSNQDDTTWWYLLGLPSKKCDKYYYQTLNSSPLEYLELNDLKILFFCDCHSFIEMYKSQEINHQRSEYFLNNLKSITNRVTTLINQEALLRNGGQELQTFHEISQCIFHFFKALLTPGQRGRKLMFIAAYHLNQFTYLSKRCNSSENHIKEGHIYLSYLSALIEVGCGKWEKATSILHRALKRKSSPPLINLLCKLYVEIGMPNVAKYIAQKYTKDSVPSVGIINIQPPTSF